MSVSRRDFLGAGAAAAAGLALPKLADAMPVITVRDRSELIPKAVRRAARHHLGGQRLQHTTRTASAGIQVA